MDSRAERGRDAVGFLSFYIRSQLIYCKLRYGTPLTMLKVLRELPTNTEY